MRIIGGKYKGRRIPVAHNLRARPTTDFARENLFNILSNHFDFEECSVLDLFSGTGSVSYEFASRNAKHVELVEADHRHLQFIKKVIEQLGIDCITPIKAKAETFLKKTSNKYAIIFADPPYASEELPHLPSLVFAREVLEDDGWFILEHSQNHDFKRDKNFYELRKYGSVHFSIFRNQIGKKNIE